jgi:class 3 adenylate cyclase
MCPVAASVPHNIFRDLRVAHALRFAPSMTNAQRDLDSYSRLSGPLRHAPKPSIRPRCQFCRQPTGLEQKFCGACGAFLNVRCERKQATVLFLDVCGFTAISERLDPEDVRAIMEAAFDIMLNAVHAHGGRVNQFLGDGVMALFGDADGASDHAVQALRAAVSIQDDLGVLRRDVQKLHGVDFRVRAGVHTGFVTVGVIGRGLRNDYVSHGETTRVAARLVAAAPAGRIVVSSATRDLAASAYTLQDFAGMVSDGEPLHTWIVEADTPMTERATA